MLYHNIMPCPCMMRQMEIEKNKEKKKSRKSQKPKKSRKSRKPKKQKKSQTLKGGKTKKNDLKKCKGDVLLDKKKVKYCVGKCPHAQGTVRFTPDEKFLCNRHGALFAKTGEVLRGPATSPLYVIKI